MLRFCWLSVDAAYLNVKSVLWNGPLAGRDLGVPPLSRKDKNCWENVEKSNLYGGCETFPSEKCHSTFPYKTAPTIHAVSERIKTNYSMFLCQTGHFFFPLLQKPF